MKKVSALILCLLMVFTFMLNACGGTNDGSDDSVTGGYITVDPLEIEGFNETYLPDKTAIEQREGQIDVNIIFEGTEAGWEALAEEYERLHSGAVYVHLAKLESGKYKELLNYEVQNSKTEWDIVQGNLIESGIESKCVNMYSAMVRKNEYAGNKIWRNVLERAAYTMGLSADTTTYMLNTENLQTAWFVNKNAMAEAGVSELPETWDELIDLCSKLKAVGYDQPLGISLDPASVDSNQFTWLIRVYGDYYYRNEYNNLMVDENYQIDVTAQDPENDKGFNVVDTKFFNLILDDTDAYGYYVGAKSDKYKEFLEQFRKMYGYLNLNVLSASQENLRAKFKSQDDGKHSPQIMLDYSGKGLEFASSDKIDMDFFDYPAMISEGGFIDEGTLVRDVGGSGGYLSIISHDSKQNALNLDFLKFVLSPYGQSVYYKALSEAKAAPNGITTVKNEYVIVPQIWQQFFNSDKISFTGLSDNNPFVRDFLRYLGKQDNTVTDFKNFWRQYLTGYITTQQFANQWHDSLMIGWKAHANKNNWNVDCYKTWGGPTR